MINLIDNIFKAAFEFLEFFQTYEYISWNKTFLHTTKLLASFLDVSSQYEMNVLEWLINEFDSILKNSSTGHFYSVYKNTCKKEKLSTFLLNTSLNVTWLDKTYGWIDFVIGF